MGLIKRLMVLIIFPTILAAGKGNQTIARPDDVCAAKKCSPYGPAVSFPFFLLEKQPENCGYGSGFNLHCDELNRTILELPSSSIKFEVINISYRSQTIALHSLEPCLAKQLRYLDISTTPFLYYIHHPLSVHHIEDYYPPLRVEQYSLFNCSSSSAAATNGSFNWHKIPCLQSQGYKVYATPTDERLDHLTSDLESCARMYDTNSVVSPEIFTTDFINLHWFSPQISPQSNGTIFQGGRSGALKILLISGPIVGGFLIVLAIGATLLVCYKMEQQKENQKIIKIFLEDYAAMKPTRYSYAEIKKITNDFKDKLGEGGYGKVFKGQISNKIFVAVKLLHNSTENGEEFINEVGTMGTIHHVNVVRLLGFCADGYKRALVYEFLPNGSLEKFIFPNGVHHTLGMRRLQDIAIGIARGIEYLHQGCEQRILHFDIKPHNILLDENFNPKIADFGLAKLCEKGKSVVSMTAARGTMGYIAPEVFSRQFGKVSFKSDIYSFGMLLLEMVGQRKNIDPNVQNVSQVYFPEWVYGRLVDGEELRIQVEEDGEDKIAKKLAIIGLWCIQWSPADRPSITYVLQMLGESGENLSLSPNPFSSRNGINPSDPNEHRRPFSTALTVITELE